MAELSSAKIETASTVQWSDGSNFDGYVLLQLAMPELGSGNYPHPRLAGQTVRLRLPDRVIVPIVDGVLDTAVEAIYNADITPPGSKYVAHWYDLHDAQIAIAVSLFSITADPHTLTPPTLTAPTAETDVPDPGASTAGTITNTLTVAPTLVDIAGTKNGSNTAFTLSTSGTGTVLVFLNGQRLDEGVSFTRSGLNITAVSPFIPESGDVYEAVVW